MNTIDNCFLSDLLHSVHSVPEVIHPEILRVLLSFHIPTLELRKCHHPSSIIHHPLSSSLFIFPPWNCVSFFLELRKCHHSQLAPSSPTCVWSNELREREKEKRNLLNLLFLDQQPAQIDKTDRFTSPQYPIVLATASLSSDVWSLESIQFPCSNDWKSSLVTTVVQFRKTAVYLSVNQYFDYLVMLTILANCAFLAMTEPINEAE